MAELQHHIRQASFSLAPAALIDIDKVGLLNIHRRRYCARGIEYEGIRFERDNDKAEANIANHAGVTFFQAITTFTDPLSGHVRRR